METDDGQRQQIYILAICTYDQTDEYYLFACDGEFNVLGDTVHSTVEQ
ncbi:hypothetical protein ACFO0S_04105 [Chryseomicrobium palamuruense]|uniref:Uncharacterized protein n=1 Tax=Chryseomicrobium palamuruense TaxID=682973 RepID=A0ABV8UTK0_9BACL